MPHRRQNRETGEVTGAQRRCLATGAIADRAALLRFVVSPDGLLTVDPGNELPGRGLWITPSAAALQQALTRRAFQKAARQPLRIAEDQVALVERVLTQRCLNLLGLARRAGQLTAGFEKVREQLRRGEVAVLVAARDGAADGRRKLRQIAPDLPLVELFDSAELSLAMGRENVVHAALGPGGLAQKLLRETARLSGFRVAPATQDESGDER